MSSEEGFLDIIYLGIFVILSTAFDARFYLTTKPPTTLIDEVAYAIRHFHSLLHVFSLRFLVLLDGETVAHSYVVDRMLAEFAAAAVVFSKDIQKVNNDDEGGDETTFSTFTKHIEGILQESFSKVVPYYSLCVDRCHKDFVWTGPWIQILPRSQEVMSVLSLTTRGELLDLPAHAIYVVDLDHAPHTTIRQLGKRRCHQDNTDLVDKPKKRKH
jgi:hypothetical protein